ncbi:hypothetical protein DJ028_07540 [Pseudomonas veronii]|nr:hypothetical protein DJ028_07540 [Pseudomonas veronii]
MDVEHPGLDVAIDLVGGLVMHSGVAEQGQRPGRVGRILVDLMLHHPLGAVFVVVGFEACIAQRLLCHVRSKIEIVSLGGTVVAADAVFAGRWSRK